MIKLKATMNDASNNSNVYFFFPHEHALFYVILLPTIKIYSWQVEIQMFWKNTIKKRINLNNIEVDCGEKI